MKNYKNISEYIDNFPKKVQPMLIKLRTTIKKHAPDSNEKIGYGIPTFVLNKKNLVHFGAYENHVGFYPGPAGVNAFKNELKKYKTSKGAIQFPLDKPLPLPLIAKIVKFRVEQNVPRNELPRISNPAQRALAAAKIKTLKDLSKKTEMEILALHGIGPTAIPKLHSALKQNNLSFRK